MVNNKQNKLCQKQKRKTRQKPKQKVSQRLNKNQRPPRIRPRPLRRDSLLNGLEIGNYSNPVNFGEFACSHFVPHLYNSALVQNVGCGASAISLLTGINPYKTLQLFKGYSHFPDSLMVRALEMNKVKVLKLTQSNLTNNTIPTYNIEKNHVVLLSCLMMKKEATWVVLWNNFLFHNFEVSQISRLEFLNFPILSAYLLKKKEWKL